jgi:aminomethyltransferase
MATGALRRTPLYEEHKTLGARLVDFAGWEMPVQYEGIKAEHEAVRKEAGLFDVSHMGEVVFRGPQAEEAVQRLVTRDVSRLAVGQAGYAAVCLPSGGTVDDVLVYRTPDDFLIVVNASNREKDVAHFEENVKDLDVEVVDDSDDWALLALQGPRAVELLQPFTQTELSPIKYYRYEVGEVEGAYAIISRTGYTGEDGFELFVRPDDAPLIWRKLIDAGAAPVGLGARDTLRLEAGMCLYGNELDAETTPLEAGIGFAVNLDKEQEFLGKEALRGRRKRGSGKSSSASRSRGVGSPATTILSRSMGETVGSVTSGTLSPTLDEAIGLALVAPDVEDEFEVVIREQARRSPDRTAAVL